MFVSVYNNDRCYLNFINFIKNTNSLMESLFIK